jgi:aryl-alcohol dehydrogenase-like predicted oxidoreductase
MTPPAALGIGTATFLAKYGLNAGAPPDEALLRAAIAAGVTYLDTAADYGESEGAVGRVLAGGVRVCTKIKPAESLAAVRASVDRLGAPPDTILMHSAGRDQLASAPAIEALQAAKRSGLTKRIGASTYGSADAAFAIAQPWLDVLQVEYSILNQSVIKGLASRGATGTNQEIVVRSVMCKGLLTSRRTAVPKLVAQVQGALAGIDRCAREWDRTIETLAIRFALDTSGVDIVLVGVSGRDELEAALAAAASPRLTREQWNRLAAFDRSEADAAHPERWTGVS